MIPPRMWSEEAGGGFLRFRIAACRKRLREVRAIHKTHPIRGASEDEIGLGQFNELNEKEGSSQAPAEEQETEIV